MAPQKHSGKIQLASGIAESIDLDPTWAELLLSNIHPLQRKINESQVARIVTALEEGNFRCLGDTIRLDRQDRLTDGQHRCMGVLRTGITIPRQLLVTLNDDDAIAYIDTELGKRSLRDVQRITGRAVPQTTVSAAILIEHFNFSRKPIPMTTQARRAEIIAACPHLDALTHLYNQGKRRRLMPSGVLAAAVRCFKKDPEVANVFFEAVAINKPVIEGTYYQQINTLTSWLMSARPREGNGTNFPIECAEKTIRTWNAWRQGRPLGKVLRTGNIPEVV